MYTIGLLVLIKLIGVIECGGILDLAFVKFFHNDSQLHCDEAECDFKFVICLDAANGNYVDIEDCFYRRLEEFELPEVAINFNHWPGALLLKVAIFDRRTSSDELVDNLHALLEAEPGQGKQIEMRSKTILTVNFTVQCDKDFYGPLCSTFCVPQDNKIGHYSCDTATGALVCHSGWKGRFCTDKVLEPDKILDIDDNAISSSEDIHLEDRTTIESAEGVTTVPFVSNKVTEAMYKMELTTFTTHVLMNNSQTKETPPLLNGSAGNLETVIRDVLRHEVGDETSDRLGIHFEITDGFLKYAIYAKNGTLPPHMAEQVFKLRPNIESAFVHLASTHHEAPSAVIPHKRRGIPEWGILTVIVGIVFIAIITMRQAQKYCGRTHKALKPQELHEEKDAESMPTTSAANYMNPVYNST